MTIQIIQVSEMLVVGIPVNMQRHETHKIKTLWQQFSPRKSEITNLVNSKSIAMQTFTLNEKKEPNNKFVLTQQKFTPITIYQSVIE